MEERNSTIFECPFSAATLMGVVPLAAAGLGSSTLNARNLTTSMCPLPDAA